MSGVDGCSGEESHPSIEEFVGADPDPEAWYDSTIAASYSIIEPYRLYNKCLISECFNMARTTLS